MKTLSTAQLTTEIVSTIEVYRDIEGQMPDATNVMDALCDEARKAGFRFNETAARQLIPTALAAFTKPVRR
jgi:hypothetical protein